MHYKSQYCLSVLTAPSESNERSQGGGTPSLLQLLSQDANMPSLHILSWHTRGLNSPVKRSLVFQFIKTHSPHICILQETHLVGSRTLTLKKPWIRYHYHSTHSNFARGISILVHKSLPFRLLDLVLDSEGRYVLIHAQIHSIKWVIAGLNLPPPSIIVSSKSDDLKNCRICQ